MRKSVVKERMRKGETIVGARCCYTDPEVMGLMAMLGFHFNWICTEHRRIDPPMLAALTQACVKNGADVVVRLRPSNYSEIGTLLDSGVTGIMIPQVKGPEEVREVAAAVKFPPEGHRGSGGNSVDSDYGLTLPEEYFPTANENTFLIVQVETLEVVDHIEEIAAIDAVDVVFVGPGDLTLSLGIPGQQDHPDVLKIMRRVVRACEDHGKVAGIASGLPQIPEQIEMGFRLFSAASDFRSVLNGLRAARSELEAIGIDFTGNGQV